MLKKSSGLSRKSCALLVVFATLSSCALFDVVPENGFPTYETAQQDYVAIAPESTFDFHNNPTFGE